VRHLNGRCLRLRNSRQKETVHPYAYWNILRPSLLLECGEVAWDIEEFSKSIEELSEIVSTLENSLPLTIKTFLCF
jgi:hypothetical protein